MRYIHSTSIPRILWEDKLGVVQESNSGEVSRKKRVRSVSP